MGGVDMADYLLSLYCVDRKLKKWWHRLFWGFLNVSFVNSCMIYFHLFEKQTLKQFRRNVALGLISKMQIAAKEGAQ